MMGGDPCLPCSVRTPARQREAGASTSTIVCVSAAPNIKFMAVKPDQCPSTFNTTTKNLLLFALLTAALIPFSSASVAPSYTLGTQKVLVVRTQFSDLAATLGLSAIQSRINSVNNRFKSMSYNSNGLVNYGVRGGYTLYLKLQRIM